MSMHVKFKIISSKILNATSCLRVSQWRKLVCKRRLLPNSQNAAPISPVWTPHEPSKSGQLLNPFSY